MSNKVEERGLVPRLRFPEFRDAGEWEEEKLDDLVRFQDGFAFKSTDFEKSKENATQVIRITDINNKNSNEDKVYVPDAFLESNNLGKYIVDNGDLLLSLTGAAGFNFYFWNGGRAVINQRTAKITPKKKSDHALARLLEPLVHEKINARGEGQNNNLSKEFLSSIVLQIPEPAEQQKIADCLSSLDELIILEAQKLDTLKTHKKGLMQQLFPAEGETLPKLRFPEFREAGEWNYMELDPFLQEYSERVSANTEIPIYSSTRTGLKFQRDYYDNRELENDGEYGLVPEGYFVYRHMSDDGAFKFNINKTGGKIAVSKEYPVFTTVDLHPDFLFYLLNDGEDFKAFAFAQKKGGTRTRLYLKVLRTWKALLPSYPEQQKIADCLTSLDDLITAQTQKLAALKDHKKGLMQQLFPSVGGVDGEAGRGGRPVVDESQE